MPHLSLTNSLAQTAGAAIPPTGVDVECFESLTFANARAIQDTHFRRCEDGGNESLLWCSHPPTLSVGMSSQQSDFEGVDWGSMGIEVLRADRGGAVTYHGPGQLVLYPTISLRRRGLGVRRFVQMVLDVFAATCAESGVPAETRLNPAGLWIAEKKVGAVGLRIRQGITSHGFSMNIENDLTPYARFTACGLKGVEATSLRVWCAENAVISNFSVRDFADRVSSRLCERLETGGC